MNTEVIYNKDKNEIFTTGIRLQNARKKLGLSQRAVAERLCLKVSIIRDIEEDKIPTGLALTFLHGYIRSYAKLVYVPENELFPVKEKQKEPVQKTKVMPIYSFLLKNNNKKRDDLITILTILLLFAVITLTGVWWWQNYKIQQEEEITSISEASIDLKNTEENESQVCNIEY